MNTTASIFATTTTLLLLLTTACGSIATTSADGVVGDANTTSNTPVNAFLVDAEKTCDNCINYDKSHNTIVVLRVTIANLLPVTTVTIDWDAPGALSFTQNGATYAMIQYKNLAPLGLDNMPRLNNTLVGAGSTYAPVAFAVPPDMQAKAGSDVVLHVAGYADAFTTVQP